MNNTKVLAELEFNDIINGSAARTQTGADLLNKYKTADTRRVIWFANDNSIACMMVPEKLSNGNNNE